MFFKGGKKMENTFGGIEHDCFQSCTSHFAWLYFCDISFADIVLNDQLREVYRENCWTK